MGYEPEAYVLKLCLPSRGAAPGNSQGRQSLEKRPATAEPGRADVAETNVRLTFVLPGLIKILHVSTRDLRPWLLPGAAPRLGRPLKMDFHAEVEELAPEELVL